MIQIPYEKIIEKIKAASGLSDYDIEGKIKAKMDQLSGFISRDGAAHIVANELGVKILDNVTGRMKIESIMPGMRSVETVGKAVAVFDVREFNTGEREGKVGSMVIGDETGSVRLVCWGAQAEKMRQAKAGDIIRVKDVYVKDNRGNKELHLNDRSLFQLNPPGESVGLVKQSASASGTFTRKKISELAGNESNIELLGTVVQTFEPKFFEVCPNCGGRARPQDEGFVCSQHGPVKPDYSYLISLFLDDGTDNIRTVFFRDQVESLLGMNKDEILRYKDAPEDFEPVKNDLLGSMIKVTGRTKKNEMYDRLEFAVAGVEKDPDPEAELKILMKEGQEG